MSTVRRDYCVDCEGVVYWHPHYDLCKKLGCYLGICIDCHRKYWMEPKDDIPSVFAPTDMEFTFAKVTENSKTLPS